MAAVAEAMIKAGINDADLTELLKYMAISLWSPAHNTLDEYVEGAINEARVRISATQKSLYTWVPPRSTGGET